MSTVDLIIFTNSRTLSKKSNFWNPSNQQQQKVELLVAGSSTAHERLIVETIVNLLYVENLAAPINFLFKRFDA